MILNRVNLLKYCILFIFVGISIFCAYNHEFWADEIQAYLIAKNESYTNIITNIGHQEAQPILWHLILKIATDISGLDTNILFISIFFMTITIWLILFKINIPLIFKILIPFGYGFIYQYNIVSRNYCLAYLALTLVALLYENRHIYTWRYAFSLLFLAYSTAFYTPIAAILGIFWFIESKFSKKYIPHLTMLLISAVLLIWQIFPISSILLDDRLNTPPHFSSIFGFIFFNQYALFNIFIFCWFIYILLYETKSKIEQIKLNRLFLILCICFFYLAIFIFSSAKPHHENLTFGLLLFNLYIMPTSWSKNSYIFFIFILILHIYWGYCAILHDIKTDTASAKSVYLFLKKNELLNKKIHMVGYQTLPLFEFIDKSQTTLNKNDYTYATWHEDDPNVFNNYSKRISPKYDILVLDYIAYEVFFNNKHEFSNFEVYSFNNSIPHKDGLGFNQSLFILVKK